MQPLPQNIEAEEVVLGACLIDNKAMNQIANVLNPEVFYKAEHGIIWNAMTELHREGWPIDLITVVTQLRKKDLLEKAGGAYNLVRLTSNVATSANIEYHAYLVLQEFIARKQLEIYNNATNEINNKADILTVFDAAQKALLQLDQSIFKGGSKSIEDIALSALNIIEEAGKTDNPLVGIPSGITELDKILGGFRKDNLIILAARPGMGKTSLALSIAKYLTIDFKKPVAIFSLEMGAEQLFTNLLSIQTQIENTVIERGKLHDAQWHQVHAGTAIIASSPIHIEDAPGLNINQLRSKCLDLKAKHSIELFIVDYLQLMQGTDRKLSTYDRIGEISRGLKLLAKETKTPFIALSQLSREVEKRPGKRPILADLRENGSIEQDADVVLFPYRPEYYGYMEDDNGNPTRGLAELIVAKNRNGTSMATAICEFVDTTVTFRDKRERMRYFDNEPDF